MKAAPTMDQLIFSSTNNLLLRVNIYMGVEQCRSGVLGSSPCHRCPLPIHMITAFDDHTILFQGHSHSLECINSQSGEVVSSVTSMHDMGYHHPETNMIVEYTQESAHGYDVIPYIPSLVTI
jgi:hypothetical protein